MEQPTLSGKFPTIHTPDVGSSSLMNAKSNSNASKSGNRPPLLRRSSTDTHLPSLEVPHFLSVEDKGVCWYIEGDCLFVFVKY
jgi:hypothetical protein